MKAEIWDHGFVNVSITGIKITMILHNYVDWLERNPEYSIEIKLGTEPIREKDRSFRVYLKWRAAHLVGWTEIRNGFDFVSWEDGVAKAVEEVQDET